jgi:hypothetical protein
MNVSLFPWHQISSWIEKPVEKEYDDQSSLKPGGEAWKERSSGRFAKGVCQGAASWFIRKTEGSQRSRETRITLKTEAGFASRASLMMSFFIIRTESSIP